MSITRKIATKTVAVLLAAFALVGVSSISSTANASSQGFRFTNSSSQPLTLVGVKGDAEFESRPGDGSVLKPGETVSFEISDSLYATAHVTYEAPSGRRTTVLIQVALSWTPGSRCEDTVKGECVISDWYPKYITLGDPDWS